ncbi:DUF1904 domain-containing protein [Shewanella sp. Choline-02u-19]|jgi:hypothetical protein|uniref:DUF1904 family protein n=1 Tax=unclassified Shewanella TaxID=196818 RepID=UPI000C34A995|nr:MULTISPECIES: DUF1904 family protein [unclassified Shewanella]PKG58090.1 DUF1904 domain-containing protein [Shewanella sp. GutDb-MelDb]PKG75317.1 DUF1904 domain-containing protein [Shewanella sp. GutCb]PKH57988.1 DUF1904 domain-containing protein [Shewanella sp. Bg11-22]PKI27463.1 DUF1904 domain-containing protein [Shewanella sp. Choline-02u-19]
MPHIKVYGMPESVVANLSDQLIEVLAEICQVNAESFIIDCISSQSYRRGQCVNDTAQVEVLWFPKDPETHHRAEKVIREAVIRAYPGLKHTIVMFRELTPSTYYKDGTHY